MAFKVHEPFPNPFQPHPNFGQIFLDITYGVTFPVQAVATSLDSWTMRQIGVFHRYDPNELQNLWVFFHVGLNTPAQTDIRHYASQISHQTAESTWVALHSAALFNYLPSWHSYIHYLGWKVDKIVGHPNHMSCSQLIDWPSRSTTL